MVDTYSERLCDAMDKAGVSTAELARALGISYQAVKKAREGGQFATDNHIAAARRLRVNSEWLATGKGERNAIQQTIHPLSTRPTQGVAVVGTAKLGDDGNFCELEYPVGHGDGFIDWPSRDPNAYALRCKGDSMRPRIKHGEYVVVEPNRQIAAGDEVLVKSIDGRVMVKQLAYIRDGMVYLDSVNEAYARISFEKDQIEAMHYVGGIARPGMWYPD